MQDPLINGRETTISQEKIKRVVRGYETVERFFSGNSFVAGDCLTIADFSTWSSLLVLDLLIPIDAESFPKLKAYMTRFEAHPNYNLNIEGAKKQVDLIDKFMEKAKSYHINSFELIYPKPV